MSQKAAVGGKNAAQGGTWAVLDSDEFEDLQKFVGVLAQKAAGLIVEARTGHKISNPSNPEPTSADWYAGVKPSGRFAPERAVSRMTRNGIASQDNQFGLAVREAPKVRAEFKEMVKDHMPIIDKPFGVEIIAHLPTSEEIPLEYWWFSFDTSVRDQDVRVKYVVYNRMAILLKSVIVVLRASPVNKLVRQNDYFKFSHRIFVGSPNLEKLPSVAKNFKVGPLKTPYGSIFFSGACREMAFSDFPVSHPLTEPVSRPLGRESNSPRFGFTANTGLSFSSEKPAVVLPRDPAPSENRLLVEVGRTVQPLPESTHANQPRKRTTFESLHCIGAFALASKSPSDSDEDSYEIPDKAFAGLITLADDEDDDPVNSDDNSHKKTPKSILKEPVPKPKHETIQTQNDQPAKTQPLFSSRLSLTDDGFEDEDMLEAEQLRPAFASSKSQSGSHDLASFLHECRIAPANLKSLEKKGVSVARTVKSLNQNLSGMEDQLHEFDRFVDDLRVIGDSSWVMTMSSQ